VPLNCKLYRTQPNRQRNFGAKFRSGVAPMETGAACRSFKSQQYPSKTGPSPGRPAPSFSPVSRRPYRRQFPAISTLLCAFPVGRRKTPDCNGSVKRRSGPSRTITYLFRPPGLESGQSRKRRAGAVTALPTPMVLWITFCCVNRCAIALWKHGRLTTCYIV